jgi:hypothetical protein
MEIVKSLNLNKVPQQVENNSLVCAKNIKISSDGTYITNEEGIKSIYSVNDSASKIVGVIACNTELVIFQHNTTNNKSDIYRYNEIDNSLRLVPTGWKWEGGVVKGTYTYNINDQLIIAITEINSTDGNVLKTINLDTSTENDKDNYYHLAPDVPHAYMRLNNIILGTSMPCGTYYMFIRYKITTNTYTKWFPIGIPYIIANIEDKEIINHYYPSGNDTSAARNMRTTVKMPINSNKESNTNYEFILKFEEFDIYKEFQLGYILDTHNETVCRIWQEFDIDSTVSVIFNGVGAKEYNIDDMLENAFDLTNVDTICNYRNRLYVANYEENNFINKNYEAYANRVKVRYTLTEFESPIQTNSNAVFYTSSKEVKFNIKTTQGNSRSDEKEYVSFSDIFNAFATNPNLTSGCYLIDTNGIHRNIDYCLLYINENEINTTLAYSRFIETGEIINWENIFPITNTTVYNSDGTVNNNFTIVTSIQVKNIQRKKYDTTINDFKYNINLHKRSLIPNQVYNFFIHFVNANGTFTNGFKLKNDNSNMFSITDRTHPITVSGETILADVNKSSADDIFDNELINTNRVCDVFNNFKSSTRQFGYYTNSNGDSLFKAPDVKTRPNDIIGIECTEIDIPQEFVGYFITYEEVENNVLYTSLVRYKTSSGGTLTKDPKFYASDVFLLNRPYRGLYGNLEYSINNILGDSPTYINGTDTRYLIRNSKIHRSSEYSEEYIDIDIDLTASPTDIAYKVYNIYGINKYIYTNKNKNLIRLGDIRYVKNNNRDNLIFKEDENSDIFNYPGFITDDEIIIYDPSMYVGDDGYPKNSTTGNDITTGQYANAYKFRKYCITDINLRNIKESSETISYPDKQSADRPVLTSIIVRPINQSDLFELNIANYDTIDKKKYINRNTEIIYVNNFNRTIRRSDVISDESFENSWRIFRPNNYKVISENKGNITNIVGVGLYLLVHTEHSLFMFNRDASLKTQDKDVQLTIPDAFDTEYQEIFTSDKGFGGLQDRNSWMINQYGYTFYDNDSKNIYTFDNGALNILSLPICKLLESLDIVRIIFSDDTTINNRFIISIEDKNGEYITLSYNYLVKKWISLHDYYFKRSHSTKNKSYFIIDQNSIFTFDNTKICKFESMQINNAKFPVYLSERGDISYSYLDVIYNEAYTHVKSLEFISYVLSEVIDYFSHINQAEECSNKKYSGYQCIIYTDSTYSGLLDINTANLKNQFNNYKYPYFDKGKWNFNYFRNYIERPNADLRSLIYGKYIVIRFIFNNDSGIKFKLEDVDFKVRSYE